VRGNSLRTEAVTRQLPIPDFISHGQLTHPSQTK
jgi:hypothetical protein